MKRIWIINQYASTPDTGMGGRHHYLASGLAKLGYDVTLIAASWHHLLRDGVDDAPEIEARDGYTFVRVPVPKYAHAHDKRRILNWLIFGHRLRYLPKRLGTKPDVILYSSLSLLGFNGAYRLARKIKARFVFEVRDIWPLTLVEVGGQSPRHPLLRWMQHVEDKAYRLSDAVVSNLPNAVSHMVSRGMGQDKFTWIPNGVSLSEVDNPETLSPDMAAQLPVGKFTVGYTGTLGAANALDTLIDAAVQLTHLPEIAFVLVGKGRDKDRLVARVDQLKLQNVYFVDAIPKQQIQSMLASFDACVLCWHKLPLYRFGTSANKIPEYLYSGKPVLNAFTGFGDLVTKYNAGLQVEAEDPDALAAAVLKFYNMSVADRAAMGAAGRRAVLMHHEYGALAKKLEAVLMPDESV